MPTNKAKLSAYVPPALKSAVIAFCEERGISESQGLTMIVAEYFGIKTEILNNATGGVTLDRLERLELKVAVLQSRVLPPTSKQASPLPLD